MKVRTATGKEYDCGFWGEASAGVLYIILENASMAEAAIVSSSATELATLTYIDDDGNVVETAENYTVLISINSAGQNAVRIGIRRPYVGEEV